MLKDSMDGNPFDMESYGSFYRPYGAGNFNRAPAQPAAASEATAAPQTPKVENDKAQAAKDVLANLRLRTQSN